jgi:hypothetical protein
MHLPYSVLSVLALCIADAAATSASSRPECVHHSQPNPIAAEYPGNVTGTINATIAILPIPFDLARSIIPKQYNILSHAWRHLLPDLGEDMYPALLQTVFDHDVRFGDYVLDDFSVSARYP